MHTQLDVKTYQFSALSIHQLYEILRLRQDVFVIEQQSIYDDLDGQDQSARHLCCYGRQEDAQDLSLMGYTRLRFVGPDLAKIERVVVSKDARGKGIADKLMATAITQCKQQSTVSNVQLSAQMSVLGFYQKLGFVDFGDSYDDGGIEHKDMTLWLDRAMV